MGELRLPGLATGIDTAALIKQLMIINSRRLAKYQVQKTGYEQQNTALSELRAKVEAVRSATSALSDIDNLEVFSVSSSDRGVLTLTTSSEANPGSHSILINQLATTNTWIQDTSTFVYKTDYVGAGTFIYSYNNKETKITAVADVTTLEDFVNLINQDENNPGVSASLLYQGGQYHLMLSGQETGEDYLISVNTSSTEVRRADSAFTLASDDTLNAGLTTKITELSQFTLNAGLQGGVPGEEIQITGTDHLDNPIDQFDLSVTSNTTLAHLLDAIEDAYGGNVKATLEEGRIVVTDKVSGASELTVILAYDPGSGDTELTVPLIGLYKEGGATPESLTSLTSTSFIETQSAQDSEIKIDGYPPGPGIAEVQTLSKTNKATGGTFTLTYDGRTTAAIDRGADNGAIQDALEALSNVKVGDITVSGAKLSDDGDTIFTFRDGVGDVSMISIDASNLTPSTGWTFSETTKGDSTNVWISRNSNSITDALSGITLNLHDINDADSEGDPIPIEITVSRNIAAVSQKIQSMVSAYNALMTELKSKTEYDSETKKMGILSNDIAVSFIKTQSRDPFIGIVAGFVSTIDTYIQSMDIGLTIDSTGVMEFDTEEFNDAISDDYTNVLELLGATKSGNSSNTIIPFYSASSAYTTAGTYDVEVDIDTNAITDVRIKLSTESSFRDNSTWASDLVTGMSIFDDNGNPVYPEHGFQFTVDLTQSNGTYTATVNVKQGIAGVFEDFLDEILEADGRLDVSKDILDGRITAMERRIENEEARLTKVETRLITKYARLERTLILLQQQMAAVSMVSQATFGS